MKRLAVILGTTIAASVVTAAPTTATKKAEPVKAKAPEAVVLETPVAAFNKKGYGTISGRLQSVSMYRDYDNGLNAYSSSLGIILKYASPEMSGLSVVAAYNGAGVLDSMDYGNSTHPGEALVANGRISLLNEGYVNYNMNALGLTNTFVSLGRRINNDEIFRADDIRQKSRSIMAIQAESKDLENWRFALGHSFEQSGILDTGDRWKFRDYGDVFGAGYNTDGLTWGETSYKGVENLEVALFDGIAWDVANMIGARGKYSFSKKTAILGYYRNEFDIGRANAHGSDMVGISLVQKVGSVTLEGGYFGVYGDNLEFNQLTTGFNHSLGQSLMIYTSQYNGGADTVYLKAVTRLKDTKTILYTMCNYTKLDSGSVDSAVEADFIVKQPIGKNLTVAGKLGLGYRDGPDTFATDTRIFLTYSF
jgi:hypothetical protein